MSPSPNPTSTKPRSRKSATTDCAHHVGSSSGLITIVVMTVLWVITGNLKELCDNVLYTPRHSYTTNLTLPKNGRI